MATLGLSRTLYIPHIHTANDSWETNLVVDNLKSPSPQGFNLTLYAANGSVLLNRQEYQVSAGQSLVVPLRPLNGVTGIVECGSESMRFRLGYVAKESSGGGTAEFELPEKLSDTIVFSTSNYYGSLTWSGFAVFNGSDYDAQVNATIMTTSGETNATLTVPAKEKVVDYFENQFGVPFADINSVIFSTDTHCLTGITISGKENEKLLFTGTGTERDAWCLQSSDVDSTVYGVARVGETVLALNTAAPSGTQNYYANIRGIRVSDGLFLFDQLLSGIYTFSPMGIVNDPAYQVAIAYGMDTSDTMHHYYFVARINPDDGTVMWKTMLEEGIDPSQDIDPGFGNRICVATDGTATVQALLRNKTGHVVAYSLDLSGGSKTSYPESLSEGYPTTLVYDSGTGNYYSIFTQYDPTPSTFSLVGFISNTPGNLSSQAFAFKDLSAAIPDGLAHHVLVYGGAIHNNVMTLLYNANIGVSGPNTFYSAMPSQFISGTVALPGFDISTASTEVTGLTGTLGDIVNIVKDEANDIYGFCSQSRWSNSTLLIELSTPSPKSYLGSWRVPIAVTAASDNKKFLLGFEKVWNFTSFSSPKHGNGKAPSIDYSIDGFVQRIGFVDLMNKYCR